MKENDNKFSEGSSEKSLIQEPKQLLIVEDTKDAPTRIVCKYPELDWTKNIPPEGIVIINAPERTPPTLEETNAIMKELIEKQQTEFDLSDIPEKMPYIKETAPPFLVNIPQLLFDHQNQQKGKAQEPNSQLRVIHFKD